MLLDIDTFRRRTQYDLDGLVNDLVRETHRATPQELTAWRNSLPSVASVLAHESLRGFHIHLGERGRLAIEYRLPSSAFWADLVLLGRGQKGPSAVVVELKDWNTQGDEAGSRENLVARRVGETLHPSDQVRGYVDYCRRFHSAVQERNASVSGCVYFTYASSVEPYKEGPHARLVEQFPVFARNEADLEQAFPRFLTERLTEPDPDFAQQFDAGVYKQDRGFVRQISAAIKRPATSPFVLLDKQREGYELCMACVERRLKPARPSARTDTGKSVVVINGPPGSGKSVIAAHLWATLIDDEKIDGNVVLTTTSTAQRSNWEAMFTEAVGDGAARGVVIGSNSYNPGINQPWLKNERAAGRPTTIQSWRENLESFTQSGAEVRCRDNAFAISIVDEAHGLIDPTVEGRDGMSASGWMLHAGPQAWHVIRASKVAIFLLDPAQSYRDNETTTIDRIKEFAAEFGADFTEISLEGSQFRCSGSVEYMNWVDRMLALREPSPGAAAGRGTTQWERRRGGPYVFEVFDDPQSLEEALRGQIAEGHSARFVASYSRKWLTKGVLKPHELEPERKDFNLPFERNGERKTWTRIWNYAHDENYSLFIQAPTGSAMHDDQLCEVGCPYVLRGFDFHFVGLLWLSDLVWRDNRWRVNLEHVHESAWRLAVSAAKKRRAGAEDEVIRRLQRGYRILLSRAMLGTYVWFEDDETREHVSGLLGQR
jgi:hypothetical protein